ncbi:MAG: 4Fe-4S dicluster domain-containing protein [Chloroflexi bacterium]|nr:4Fe-4S dicluster domain-containing protein [Chloroflexota bacterium]
MSTPQDTGLTRRQFLKTGGAAAAAICGLTSMPLAASADGIEEADETVGILVDISHCQGCDSCVLACKQANGLPIEGTAPHALDNESYCYIDNREIVTAEGQTERRYVKRQCMHCLDAACVSACPAAAMHKTETGPVTYRANRCLGCRYCQIACPFGVPQFDWNNGLGPEIHKCWLCNERLAEGQQPACVDACPTGAIRFGTRRSLLAQAHAMIDSNPDHYVDHVFGEHEVGGTSILYLSDVPFDQLGFPTDLPATAPSMETEKIMITLPFVIGGLAIALTGATAYTHRHESAERDEELED